MMKVKHLLIIIGLFILAICLWAYFYMSNKHLSEYSVKVDNKNKPHFLYEISGENDKQRLKEPTFAISDSDTDNVYVSDAGNRRVIVYNKNGKYLFEFGGKKNKQPLVYPYGIGLLNDSVIVADTGFGAIYEYNKEGKYLKTWLNAKEKFQPGAIYVTSKKKVYVTDLAQNQIIVFSEQGKIIEKIKTKKIGLGAPLGISVNDNGTVWVTDGSNYNVKLLDEKGNLKDIFDGGPKWALSMAKGLAVDKQGRIYVADTMSNVIRVFNQKGISLFTIGTENLQQNRFKLPLGLSINDDGYIFIADQGNNKIQVWSWS